jgi:hypothetical protein
MQKAIEQLDSSKSPGVCEVPVKLLKATSTVLAPLLAQLYNDCVAKRRFPDILKYAIVTPLYKRKGLETDMNSYRGISVLPPLSKCFERIMAADIRLYFDFEKKLLFSGQHGFRAGHSCETALHEIISKCLHNVDKRLINLLLFVDFKKAFDMLNPDLLLHKLGNYGFKRSAIEFLKDYFTSRKQSVKYKKAFSEALAITLGVPQGSVLGPLLFLIFINDLPEYLKAQLADERRTKLSTDCDHDTKMFADDTTLVFADGDINKVTEACKSAIRNLIDWCRCNRLPINWSKTFVMLVGRRRLPKERDEHLVYKDIKIKYVKSFKLLGVTIDERLNFNEYISELSKTINKRMYSIKRIFYLPYDVKLQFFKTFILPHFDYCLSLVIYFSKKAVTRLAKAYYFCLSKLLRFNFINRSTNEIEDMLTRHALHSFHHRIVWKLTKFAHDIKHSYCAPSELKGYISKEPKEHHYILRESTIQVLTQDAKTNHGDWTFANFFARFYNKVDSGFFTLSTISSLIDHYSPKESTIITAFIKHFAKFNFTLNFYL